MEGKDMLSLLNNWQGSIEINGTEYSSVAEARNRLESPLNGNIHIVLKPISMKGQNEANHVVNIEKEKEYRVSVKRYMTQKASPEFDFMAKWNNNEPMPLRTMVGKINKETRGMVHMTLHGDIYAKKICTCMMCGRPLTNPISQYFGIGPECGGHNYVNPFDDEEQLNEAVAEYKAKLQKITWTGWVIKSAITEQEELD